jgi:hypothetical protein
MVNKCANPKCSKPLHYLREGRIFVFDAESENESPHRMEHYWLCGECSRTMRLEKTVKGVRTVMKATIKVRKLVHDVSQPLAS